MTTLDQMHAAVNALKDRFKKTPRGYVLTHAQYMELKRSAVPPYLQRSPSIHDTFMGIRIYIGGLERAIYTEEDEKLAHHEDAFLRSYLKLDDEGTSYAGD